jgi:hypothetical protein
MPLVITPEIGIPLPINTCPEELDDFRDKARALFDTVNDLVGRGVQVEVTDSDRREAAQASFSEKLDPKKATPGTIVHLNSILNEWDQEVLDVGRRLRNYVTNKLIIESTDGDPKIRLKALENLGKLSTVGLFADRVDVTVTHRTLNDIESDLKRTLELYGGEVIDVTPLDAPKSLAELDLDTEFGLAGSDLSEITEVTPVLAGEGDES